MSDAPEQTKEELLATSTAPANIPFQMKGFADENTAQDLATRTATYIRYIGTRMNLEDLDGVTVAYDYAKALSEIDRGYESSHVLTASTEIAHGVAMAPGVFRDGVLRTHLAFNANVLMHLMDGVGENFFQVYYQLAHECGHAHDRTAFDVAIPGLLQRPYDFGSDLARIQFTLGWGMQTRRSLAVSAQPIKTLLSSSTRARSRSMPGRVPTPNFLSSKRTIPFKHERQGAGRKSTALGSHPPTWANARKFSIQNMTP